MFKKLFNNLEDKGRKVILDIETTGLDFGPNKIVEIGMLELLDDHTRGRSWFMAFNSEGVKFEEGAAKTLGYNEHDTVNRPYLKDYLQEVLDFIGDSTIIIHNNSFDITFINLALKDAGFNKKLSNPLIDTMVIARSFMKPTKAGLDYVADHFSIINNRGKHHNALRDCELIADIYPFIVQHEARRESLKHQKSITDFFVKPDLSDRIFTPFSQNPTDEEWNAFICAYNLDSLEL